MRDLKGTPIDCYGNGKGAGRTERLGGHVAGGDEAMAMARAHRRRQETSLGRMITYQVRNMQDTVESCAPIRGCNPAMVEGCSFIVGPEPCAASGAL